MRYDDSMNKVDLFNETMTHCSSNVSLIKAIENSKLKQELFLGQESYIDAETRRYEDKARIVVSKKRTIEAASAYRNHKVCVLNFASATTPGGGVLIGSNGQEESLCRISTLYPCLISKSLKDEFYLSHIENLDNIHNDDIIYTPNVVAFRYDGADYRILVESEWTIIDVISCAAPNFRKAKEYIGGCCAIKKYREVDDDILIKIFEQRIRHIFEIAKNKREEVLVLGAFGCGAFRNPPYVVATAFKNIVDCYIYDFKVIEFAIFSREKVDEKFEIFRNVFCVNGV